MTDQSVLCEVITMEKNADKRQEILDAAIKLFSERGFEKTTVDEIAARANVGKGTIYLYFENKEQIFFAVIKEGMTEINRRFEAILTRNCKKMIFQVMTTSSSLSNTKNREIKSDCSMSDLIF